MSDDSRGMRFSGLYRQWVGHDLAYHGSNLGSFRPDFYEGLSLENEPVVWRYIEERYLLQYKDLAFEWSAEGLWRIPFPGSVALGEYRSPADSGLPERLARRIRAWHANLDSRDPFLYPDEEEFDYPASDAEGLEVAKQVKLFLGKDHYVEFRPLREIAVRAGEAVELGVPAFIADLAR